MAVNKVLKQDKSGGVDIKPGSYTGLLAGIVHLGTQKVTYKGVTSLIDQVCLQFELQDVLLDNGKPVTMSKVERNSLKPKANLMKLGKAMGADVEVGINFEDLVGKPVLLSVDFNEARTRTGIKGYTALPVGMNVKPLTNTPRVLLDVDQITEAQKSELPEWLQLMINGRVLTGTESHDSAGGVEL